MSHMKYVLTDAETGLNPTVDELARTIMDRIGLEPRKRGSTTLMFQTLLELYERSKSANRDKHPENAIVTVEEMAAHAGISRQTMYEYLRRWLALSLISKSSYILDGKVIIGYRLNGATLESAFDKAAQRINNNLDTTMRYVRELQRIIKNEKIRKAQSPIHDFRESNTENNNPDSRITEQ